MKGNLVANKHLITGGAGFIGSNLARYIRDKGHDVVVLDNFATGKPENLTEIEDQIVLIDADIRDRGAKGSREEGIEASRH